MPEDTRLKAHDLAADVMKQIMALSTATIAITVSFAKDLAPETSGPYLPVLGLAWLAYLFAIMCSLGCLMCLAGSLQNDADASTIYAGNTKAFSTIGILFFIGGTFLLGVFAVLALRAGATPGA